jgi:ATP-dependent exoDNAse (exonuclease V) alpha subunit
MDTGVDRAVAPRTSQPNTVAIYYLNVKTFGRSTGGRATAAAAYRAGERIRDERTGQSFDHSRRVDVMHKEIVLPATLAAADMSWVRDRASLWNAAELIESRKNAAVAREYLVALPHELTHAQRLGLAQKFSHELADRHGFAVDLVIHAPRPHGDARNFHAHLLTTTREILPTGLGAKTDSELTSSKRPERGLCSKLKELYLVRERWATLTNEALQEANLEVRVDHRSLRAQGIDREPGPWIPEGAWRSETQGRRSEIAERIREAYRARVQARLERAVARVSSVGSAGKLDEIRRLARQSWLQIRDPRRGTFAAPDPARSKSRELQKERDVGRNEPDDDVAL